MSQLASLTPDIRWLPVTLSWPSELNLRLHLEGWPFSNDNIHITLMSDPNLGKRKSLEATGTFNRRSSAVRHELFKQGVFFDPEDLVQLKYETLRAMDKDGYSLARASREFGLSRPTIYNVQGQLKAHGLEGLLPGKRGPKGGYKINEEVRRYVVDQAATDPQLGVRQLALRVRKRFKIEVHVRTISRALKTQSQKRGRQTKSSR